MIPSYPKVYNFGHRMISDLFKDSVLVQEKIDGSQISFGILDGELLVRSKGKHLILDNPEKMFKKGVLAIEARRHLLTPGYIYRGEYLQKPKHNVLAYDRIPKDHIIIFDVETSPSHYVRCDGIDELAAGIDFESVPTFDYGEMNLENVQEFLEKESVLGGQKIEGIVAKSHSLFAPDGKALMGKYVSERFREKADSPEQRRKFRAGHGDVLELLADRYRTEARWRKAVQVLREAGELTNTPKDIGELMRIVNHDVHGECAEEIKETLFKWAWKNLSRRLTAGLPEWYKEELLRLQFETEEGEPLK